MTDALVLDASALVARLFAETGADTVEAIMASGRAVATPIAIAEALRTCRRKGLRLSPEEIFQYLESRNVRIEPVLEEDVLAIAANAARCDDHRAAGNRGGSLSTADAVCIALAQRLGAPVVTSDGYWDDLGFTDVEVIQFR